jgi:hypothetical protein
VNHAARVTDHFEQIDFFDRLYEMNVEPCFSRAGFVLRLSLSRNGDYQRPRVSLPLAKPARDLQSIHAGRADVEKDDVC